MNKYTLQSSIAGKKKLKSQYCDWLPMDPIVYVDTHWGPLLKQFDKAIPG